MHYSQWASNSIFRFQRPRWIRTKESAASHWLNYLFLTHMSLILLQSPLSLPMCFAIWDYTMIILLERRLWVLGHHGQISRILLENMSKVRSSQRWLSAGRMSIRCLRWEGWRCCNRRWTLMCVFNHLQLKWSLKKFPVQSVNHHSRTATQRPDEDDGVNCCMPLCHRSLTCDLCQLVIYFPEH
jgi:hypothetical protein